MNRLALIMLFAPAMAIGQPVEDGANPQASQQANASGSYKVGGSASIRPSLIWDDGAKTYLDWPDGIEAPAIFAIDSSGTESLVNCYLRNGHFVIDAVYSRLLFRLDRLTARANRKANRS